DGELGGLIDAQQVQDLPVALHRANEEESQRVNSDVDGRGRALLFFAQVEEVAADGVVREGLGLAGNPGDELPCVHQVALLSPGPKVAQPHVLAHPGLPVLKCEHRLLLGCAIDTTSARQEIVAGGDRLELLRRARGAVLRYSCPWLDSEAT